MLDTRHFLTLRRVISVSWEVKLSAGDQVPGRPHRLARGAAAPGHGAAGGVPRLLGQGVRAPAGAQREPGGARAVPAELPAVPRPEERGEVPGGECTELFLR